MRHDDPPHPGVDGRVDQDEDLVAREMAGREHQVVTGDDLEHRLGLGDDGAAGDDRHRLGDDAGLAQLELEAHPDRDLAVRVGGEHLVLLVLRAHGREPDDPRALARDEIFVLVDAAVDAGVRRIVVTHPEFPSQRISVEDQRALADRGAVMERAFTTPYTGKCSWEQVFEATRAVGAERTVLSTDLGQVFNPPVEDGLAIMADMFLAAGFDEEEVRTMAVTNTRWIAEANSAARERVAAA